MRQKQVMDSRMQTLNLYELQFKEQFWNDISVVMKMF